MPTPTHDVIMGMALGEPHGLLVPGPTVPRRGPYSVVTRTLHPQRPFRQHKSIGEVPGFRVIW